MAKKRVHEIAKELKAHGIELDNKELVAELHALDFDVKSHSSSLDEDQATVAIEKIVQKHKPKPAAAPVAAAGFVVRRRRPEAAATPSSPPPAAEAAVEDETTPVATVAESQEAAVEEAAVEAQPEVQLPVNESPVVVAPPEQPAAVQPVAPVAPPAPELEQPQAAAPVPAESPAPVQPAAATPPTVTPPAAGQPVVRPGTTREVRREDLAAARPGYRPTPGPGAVRPGAPGAPRPTPAASAPGQQPQPPSVDPRTLRPTATQAVVISRPLIPVRRVTPPTGAHRQAPAAPGQRAIGAVREFKVGTDFLGRREFTDVTKDTAGKSKRGKADVKQSMSKQDIVEIARGRPTLPIRAGKKKKATKKGAKTQITVMAEEKKVIKIDESITIGDLSKTLGVKAAELIRKLMGMGKMVTINSSIDSDTATILASDYGWRVETKGFEVSDFVEELVDKPEDLLPRPPVVTIMGHVDHGKTSLLDAIRKTKVAAGEAGGITQHIGAYSVSTDGGRAITFLDTPGHEAFTAMRARGAKVTDIVIIVVAADDGVMPQTREAINHAKAAKVPIIVAINKMDKPTANPQLVKNQLMEFGLVDEELGGDTIMVPVSAKSRDGLPNLLEMLLLQAEILELKANPTRSPKGSVVEAKLERGRGPVATVIVQEGTLKLGEAVVTGTHFGRVRAMVNDQGERVEEVGPGYPVEIVGLSGVPVAGDDFHVVATEAQAKEIADHRALKSREKEMAKPAKVSVEDLFAKADKATAKVLKLVIKADVQGSIEAISDALVKLATKKVGVEVVSAGVGGINESDVQMASAANAMIVGFNVRTESKTQEIAAQADVKIHTFGIIYEAVDEVRRAMEGLLDPIRREKAMGSAEVRNLFSVPKLGTIAGCSVTEGKVTRSALVRLVREGRPVYTGKVGSLRRFKDDVREVQAGFECGLSIEGYTDVKVGDVVQAYEIEEIRPSLD